MQPNAIALDRLNCITMEINGGMRAEENSLASTSGVGQQSEKKKSI